MKNERRKKKKKKEKRKPWEPRAPYPFPVGKYYKSPKDYNRKEGKHVPNWG